MKPRAAVLGGTGHIGSFLTPRLVDMGYEVTVYTRGGRAPYTLERPQWAEVTLARRERDEAAREIAASAPDLICDLISYTIEQAAALAEPAAKRGARLISIGSIWIYEAKLYAPVDEAHPRTAADEYGANKAKIERYLLGDCASRGLRATVVHPGHISGPGWPALNPQGHFNPRVYRDIAAGKPLLLPDEGQATLHHVHADDVARLFEACLKSEASVGEAFHAVAARAVTARGLAEGLFDGFGQKCRLEYAPMAEYLRTLAPEEAAAAVEHFSRSPVCSMEKAYRLLGFEPAHTIVDTVLESARSLI